MPNFGDYQLEIYFAGLQGQRMPFPIDIHELEAEAIPPCRTTYAYVAGGAGDERTRRINVEAFEHLGAGPADARRVPRGATCPSSCSA